MKVKSVNFSQLSDIMGFTILLNEIDDCYNVLGLFIRNILMFLEDLKTTFLLQNQMVISLFIQL